MTTRFKGFTIIELMVGMGTLTIVTTIVLGIWVSGIQNYSLVSFTQAREASFFDTYNRVDNHVRIAKNFPASYLDTATNTMYTTNSSTLIMELHALTEDGNICDYTDTVVYTYSGTTLTERMYPDVNSVRTKRATIIGQNISSLTFTQLKEAGNHRIVTLALTSQKQVNRQVLTSTHAQKNGSAE